MKKRKVKRYQEGGEAELKARGLESSKGDRVSFLERLKMGNIDDPRSEAYRRFGAGRAKMDIEAITPVPESAKESSDYTGRRIEDMGDSSYTPKGRAGAPDIGYGGGDEEEAPARGGAAEAPAVKTFKQAFAAARRAGDKSFEFDGKKYTTEMAAPKSKAALLNDSSSYDRSSKRPAASADKGSSETRTSADIRAGRSAPSETKSGFGPKITYGTPEQLEKARKSYYSGFESKPTRTSADIRAGRGMKSGGKVSSASSRADGIAQRGKTRGRVC